MGLTILYLGNFRHAHCTEVHLARDLENLGHTVIRLQEDPEWHKDPVTPPALYDAVLEHKPDLVLWTRTWGLPYSATDFWRWCEDSRGAVTASYHLDLYFGLKREADMSMDPFWTTQYVFTPDGNPESERRFAALGVNHYWSPPAIVSDECVPGVVRREWEWDVIFVGSRNYHPEWPWRRELIDGLAKHYGDRFHHYGYSWESTIRTGLREGHEEPGLWLNDLYASAKVVVGDSLNLPGNERYISDRYFEVMGRGGFLIGPWVPVLSELNVIRGDMGWFYNEPTLAEVFELVDAALNDCSSAELRATGRHAQIAVANQNTYKHRLAAALKTMELT